MKKAFLLFFTMLCFAYRSLQAQSLLPHPSLILDGEKTKDEILTCLRSIPWKDYASDTLVSSATKIMEAENKKLETIRQTIIDSSTKLNSDKSDFTNCKDIPKIIESLNDKNNALKKNKDDFLNLVVGNVVYKGLYLVILKDSSNSDFSKDMWTERCRAVLAPRAIKDLVEGYISSVTKTENNVLVEKIEVSNINGKLENIPLIVSKPRIKHNDYVMLVEADVTPVRVPENVGGELYMTPENQSLKAMANCKNQQDLKTLMTQNNIEGDFANEVKEKINNKISEIDSNNQLSLQKFKKRYLDFQKKQDTLSKEIENEKISLKHLYNKLSTFYIKFVGQKETDKSFSDTIKTLENVFNILVRSNATALVEISKKKLYKSIFSVTVNSGGKLTELATNINKELESIKVNIGLFYSEQIKMNQNILEKAEIHGYNIEDIKMDSCWLYIIPKDEGYSVSILAKYKTNSRESTISVDSTPIQDKPQTTNAPTPLIDKPQAKELSVSTPTAQIEINPSPQQSKVDIEVTTPKKSSYPYPSGRSRLYFEPEVLYVEGGSFIMGTDNGEYDERPVHKVYISGFYMGKTEVTQEQWQAVMGYNPSYFNNCPTCPVENINWGDANNFVDRLNEKTGMNYRLPTEAEWEYAASDFSIDGIPHNEKDNVAWYNYNSGGSTHPAAQKAPNYFGLYDMIGNVWEYCAEWKRSYISDTQKDPVEASPGLFGSNHGLYKILRGGSWDSEAKDCRVTKRGFAAPSYTCNRYGLRVAISFR